MYEGKAIAVVVPAYDEAEFVGEVIDTIPSFVDRVYPVDDASTDGTWAEIRSAARQVNGRGNRLPDGAGELRRHGPDAGRSDAERSDADVETTDESAGLRVVPIRHETNRGVGAAIKTGYRRAYDDGMDAVAVMAGDGQMDPDQLSQILDPVVSGRADYAKGNRLLADGDADGMSRFRLFGNAVLTLLTKVASGYWTMMDPQNGYTAISRDALDGLDLDAVFDDYGFANAMLVHLNVADARVADVPMPAQYGEEDSGIRYSTFVPQLSALLAKGFGWRLAEKHVRREFHPFVLCYGLGVVGTLVGAYATVRDARAAGSSEKERRINAKGNRYNARRQKEDSRSESTRGCGPMTMLAGLATTGLAMSFDASQNEDLHVTVDADEDELRSGDDTTEPGDDARRPDGAAETGEVSDR
ncbi:glycosyltransferase family 2 protein [Halorussus salinisoli]|uniref:glycosyltransferase family 2 protein n=1 Tax=Halorussus salinisoli TaxID=2558242 RepID=UPI0010C189DB|nr:glycosyltransferase family 2 protein [Halorussus salinisoli]